VHAPLTFDIIDTWSRRSLGGCVYHAQNPGGVPRGTSPVNTEAAETRRNARFEEISGDASIDISPVEPNAEYPTTLDLRRAP